MIYTLQNWSTGELVKVEAMVCEGNPKMYTWDFYGYDKDQEHVWTASYTTRYYNIIKIEEK